MTFLTLYKKTSTGAINQWTIETDGNTIITTYGLVGGKLQVATETVTGKNIGRSNETTPDEQAVLEAKSAWDKKLKTNHYINIEDAKAETSKMSKVGGYLPMLAQKFSDDRLEYPFITQRKLDGIRLISMKNDGIVTLWSRTGKQVTTVPHIVKDLQTLMDDGDIFDGELYQHKADFNTFTGKLRGDVNQQDTTDIQYWVYDAPRVVDKDGILLDETISYHKRYLAVWLKIEKNLCNANRYEPAYTFWLGFDIVKNKEEFETNFSMYLEEGYEGLIARKIDMPYEQKRSYNLLKYKQFDDEEFRILGIEEGSGILAGRVGSFILDSTFETTFKAKLRGSISYLKELFEDHTLWKNKLLTVRFFGKSKDNIPRFPVGIVIRDFE